MPFRLVGSVDGVSLNLPLAEGCSLLGSSCECELQVPHTTVSRRHAEVEVRGDTVTLRDLGSRNGTYIGGNRISSVVVHAGTTIKLGKVCMILEEVSELDLLLGVAFEHDEPASVADGTPITTIGLRAMDGLLLETVPRLVQRLERGQTELEIAQAAAALLFERLPTAGVELRALDGTDALLFEARREHSAKQPPVALVATGATLQLVVELPKHRLKDHLTPLAEIIAGILRVASGPPRPLPEITGVPELPDPPTVVPAVRRLYKEAAQVAAGDVGVLIRGESGTGKEVLAGYLHAASQRREGPFVTLNCAALPHDLLESELLGIERGVATGVEPRPGKFELADTGTLFLDEIADMALETQAKILRVLQEGEVYRLGASRPRPARCRIIAATNRDIDELRAGGQFREDLYYRIATWVVELPPLRHRRADIPNLAAHFLRRATEQRGVRIAGISRGAIEVLTRYHWPGNIRQLQNEMARAALFLSPGDALDSPRLGAELKDPCEPMQGTLEERLEQHERREINAALHRCDGVASAAAEELGIGRSTLYRRLRALGIDPDEERHHKP